METNTFKEKYGPFALILGAAEGIGGAFSRQLSEKGLDLFLVDIQTEKLKDLSAEIKNNCSVKVINHITDLSDPNAIDILIKSTEEFRIGLVVYNAAYSPIGPFTDYNLDVHQKLIQVNISSTLKLIHHFIPKMKANGEGGIILLSSMSALQGTALVAHYAASKAYLMILAESLWFELKEFRVDVMALIAGATGTDNYYKTKPNRKGLFIPPIMTPEEVVDKALLKLGKQPSYIPGFWNQLAIWFSKMFFGRKRNTELVSKNLLKMYGNKKA